MQNKKINPENKRILGWNIILEHIDSPLNFDPEKISFHGLM